MLIQDTKFGVVNVDKLTYAANLRNVESVASSDRYQFVKVDFCCVDTMSAIFKRHDPDCVIHLAAESHVDRSIAGPLSKSPYGQYLIGCLRKNRLPMASHKTSMSLRGARLQRRSRPRASRRIAGILKDFVGPQGVA
jgi:hypothetical protein